MTFEPTNTNDSDSLLALIYQVLHAKFGNSNGPIDNIRTKQQDEKFDKDILRNDYINELIKNSTKTNTPTPLPPVFRKSPVVQ